MADQKQTQGQKKTQQGQPGEPPQMQAEPKPPFPKQKLEKPGDEAAMEPKPRYEAARYKPAGKLEGRCALITGGDSGIGRAVAVLYAREGADVAIAYLPEEQADADETKQAVEAAGRRCMQYAGDLADPAFCRQLIDSTVKDLGKLDILISNAAHQNRKQSIEQITEEEWDRTFRTNIYAPFHLIKAAMRHLKAGASIIVTSSVTGLEGSSQLIDYSATKGAINAFVKALAKNIVEKGIRVNAVAPGPVWTPLNPADKGMTEEKVSQFGQKVPMKRPAQPEEIAPAYVFLASDADSSYITGIVLSELGGETQAG